MKTKKTDLAFIVGLMAASMRESGKMVREMEQAR